MFLIAALKLQLWIWSASSCENPHLPTSKLKHALLAAIQSDFHKERALP